MLSSKTGLLIQARTGSTRLPRKMVLDFYQGQNIFEILVDKLIQKYQGVYPIILATTNNPADQILADIAKHKGLAVYRGDSHNVLNRFIRAAETFEINNLIRICADNPFLDIEHIQTYLHNITQQPTDYLSYAFADGTPVIQSHLGLFTEYVSLFALKKVASATQNPIYLEHVTNYLYTNPQSFQVNFIDLPEYLKNKKNIRLTLDTLEDFNLLQELYKEAVRQNMTTKALIEWIQQQPEILKQMQMQIQKNQK